MTKVPAVSVILPTHNRRPLLERSIRSVLQQTFADFELIVVDDGSTDDTSAYMQALQDRRIRYQRLERGGAARARNVGLKLARAELVAFQDSDDIWTPRKLERQLELLRSAPAEVGLVVGAYVLVEPNRRRTIRSAALERGTDYGRDIVRGIPLVTPLWLARRRVIEAAGGFDESLASSEDYELAFRLSRLCRFTAVPDLVLYKKGHLESLSGDERLYLEGLRIVYGRYPEFWAPYPDEEAALFRTLAHLYRRAGAYGTAVAFALRAWGRQPLRPARRLLGPPWRWLATRLRRGGPRGPRLMRTFARLYPRATFVQIGSNDGAKHDPLRRAVLASRWSGVMVEPVPYVFERLRTNYGAKPGITLENVAVAASPSPSEMPFYHLAEAVDGELLPDWYDELGSFNKAVVLSHEDQIPDLAERLVTTRVPCVTFAELCARHGLAQVDLVHIDAEGYDHEILGSIDFSRFRPILLIYEQKHMGTADREATEARLQELGYVMFTEGADTWCVDTRIRDRRHRRMLRGWARLCGPLP